MSTPELSSIKSLFFHLFESHKSEKSNILSLYDKCSAKKQTYPTAETMFELCGRCYRRVTKGACERGT